ncbi:hypothetical protein IscW_ISCW018053 [Ixodes scapularis]|uniref:Secreted protein n=1 Tax=Ixodes scapularis TaxID=6945 RepID=B7PGG0_IXOSC|nr:hypothetical protein IscW_ISCW018053 [Ixodes scapularis]|eukprot:XP_002434282.1 hypothetical protein IscW_ISCW018053 [Ixodes scapularis]
MGSPRLLSCALLLGLVATRTADDGARFPVPFGESTSVNGCYCWSDGTECRCFGDDVVEVPANFGNHVEKL